jgi:hypothetical protein
MKIKVVMNSGKEYIANLANNHHYLDFVESLYNVNKLPLGGSVRVLNTNMMFLDEEQTILFNPSHVSSIELLEE